MAGATVKNLVLVSLDDAVAFWNYRNVFGQALETPNLDRILAQSTRFDAAYCQAPVCSPSRASFMSGRAPHQTGVTGSDPRYLDRIPAETLWPYALKRAGFYSSSGGKLVRGYRPLPDAIHAALYSDGKKEFQVERRRRTYEGRAPDNRTYYGGFRDGPATLDAAGEAELYDHQVAASAIDFFASYRGPEPFYREVGFAGTHGPWTTPKRFKEMYDEKAFTPPAAWAEGFPDSPAADALAPRNMNSARIRYWRKSVRNYFAALSYVDDSLGKVWDALKSSPHAENTLVVILADHGLHLGERDRFRKHTLWEQVANVPLIVHDPTRPAAQTVADPVALIDLGPTVMDYLGQPLLEGTPGRSLKPLVEGARDPDRAVPTFLEDSAAIRKGNYRFIRYFDGSTELYDIRADWWQTRNLGPTHPAYDAMATAHAVTCADYGFSY
ncbi:MAG: sulfatase-like hydrolase/transferase [Maritimibacter sp.]|nr:sulfatase-like hydrolase/transferase [Maritimibacter sp.]